MFRSVLEIGQPNPREKKVGLRNQEFEILEVGEEGRDYSESNLRETIFGSSDQED